MTRIPFGRRRITPEARSRWLAVGSRWVTPLSYVLIAFGITAPVWFTTSPGLLGASADSALHVWFLAWMVHALGRGQVPFFTAAATFPHTISLLWNNSDILLAFVAWPLAIVMGWVRGVNLLHVLLLAGAAAMMAVQLRRYTRSAVAAWIGGVAFGFAPFVQGQLIDGQLTWLTIGTLPLGWWVADHADAAARGRRHRALWGVATGSWVALQYLANKEFLATTILMVVLVGAWPVWRHRRLLGRVLQRWVPLLSAAVPTAALLLVVPLALQTVRRPSLMHAAGLTPVKTYIDLLSWVLPSPGQLLGPGGDRWLLPYSMWWALVVGYLGVPVILFALWALRSGWGDRLARVAAVVGVVGGCLASGEWLHVYGVATIPLPWWVFHRLPIYADAVPNRFAIFVDLGVAILLALGADRLLERSRAQVLPVALVLALFLPWVPAVSVLSGGETAPSSVPAVFRSPAVRSLPTGSVVVVAPIAIYTDGGPMLWQALDGFRYVQPFGYILHPVRGGSVSNFPFPSALGRVLVAYADHQRAGPLSVAGMRRDLQRWHVRALVVVTPATAPATVALFHALTARTPMVIAGADVWLRRT